MPCTPPSTYCTIATVIPGITEVTFTNNSAPLRTQDCGEM